MTGVAKNTIQKLALQLGSACANYLDANVRNLTCKRIQCDEIWSFVSKQKNVTAELLAKGHAGDVWTCVAIDADTKLVCSFAVGSREADTAFRFMADVRTRLRHRVQLTTDGHSAYLTAVDNAFARSEVDYSMLVKVYGNEALAGRYSPGICLGFETKMITGDPDPKHISTSYVERQNLTVRMSNRRFTRLTKAFSKKLDNHIAAIALHYMHYNFCRVHQTLRVTPAMEAKLTDHVWSIDELIGLLG